MGSYDTMIINDNSSGDYWKLDRDTGELSNLINTGFSDLSASNVTSGSTPASLLPGSNNLYSDYFNGTSAYATVNTSNYRGATYNVSLECWIEAASDQSGTDFIGLVVKNGSYGLCLNYGKLCFFTVQAGGDGSKRLTVASSAISTDTVYHVCGTYDGQTNTVQKLYVNGSQVDSQSYGGNTWQNSSNLVIGSWDTSVLFFNGRISNVATYPFTLDATSIGNHAGYTG